jgi:hypothetical protein
MQRRPAEGARDQRSDAEPATRDERKQKPGRHDEGEVIQPDDRVP